MRIIAGKLGGRVFEAPKGFTTHPMGERIRGSLFNILGDLRGQTVLDCFAGSGALGLEAISRGAESVILVEKDRVAYKILENNIKKLGVEDSAKAINTTIGNWNRTNVDKKFDLIFCDPPYNDPQFSTVFAQKNHLKPNGLMVVSYLGRDHVPTVNGVVVVDNRNYGDAALALYRLDDKSTA